jgi:GH25 family lysozyme M1 (1,4-beta-N-acetylmuramidase)
MTVQYGIDISHHQGNVDFEKVKADGVSFVILKAGGSEYNKSTKQGKDNKFEEYYRDAKRAMLPVGAYYYAGNGFVHGASAGIRDAGHFRQLLAGKKFEYPVFIDVEQPIFNLHKDKVTDATLAFCTELEQAGYYVGIYASDMSGFKSKLNDEKLQHFDHWVAKYSESGNKPVYVKKYGIWQFSSKGKVEGIKGNVDLDYAYKNYEAAIKKAHLNGY